MSDHHIPDVSTLMDRLISRAGRAAYDAPTASAEDCMYVVALLSVAESAASVSLLLASRPNSFPLREP
ncbi:hypothetical protein A5733_04335 [Mycobacterium sp. NS-7484]|uniref:hypothetical protein n=1 Tax=Mycobacterium sp. NS-7484 TaxID=1834161 RepID=UPI00096EC0B6|nr:hypothetical protein [Mycobacterium sp. NS-7484]OMC00345.1 hypothetical protein A5733_04335 [Mycobacterium sp. NS-7484]